MVGVLRLQDSRGEHGDQAILNLSPQLQPQQDRDGQGHQQDIRNSAHRAIKVVEPRGIDTLRAKLRTVVPAASDRRAAEAVKQRHHGRRGDDVAYDGEAHSAEHRLWGEAHVEEQHGQFRERVGEAGDYDGGVAVLLDVSTAVTGMRVV